jgi:hypothetical protein
MSNSYQDRTVVLCDKADGSDGVVITYEMWQSLGQPVTKSEYEANVRDWLRSDSTVKEWVRNNVIITCEYCGLIDGMHVLSCPNPPGSKQAMTYHQPQHQPKPKQRKGMKLAVDILGYENQAGQRLETLQGRLHLLHRAEQQPTVLGYSDSVYYDVLCEDHVRPACTNCRYTYYDDAVADSGPGPAAPTVKGSNTMTDTYIGDAERKEGVEHLRRAWMAGYLTEEEFTERSEQVDKARTQDDIAVTRKRLPDKLDQWAAPPTRQLRKIPAAAYAWAFGFFISASICAVPDVYITAITHGTDGGGGQKAIITVCVILGLILGVLTGGMTIETMIDRHQQRKKARRG